LRRIVGLFNEKDRMDGGKRMASNWEVILTPFLSARLHHPSPSKKGERRMGRSLSFDAGKWR
ncbi:MAG: hypothetical protein SGI94_21355, partial [Saprospiraceae bacterium]|nr:hypothetical protein [Saprospiraceae bacterium]